LNGKWGFIDKNGEFVIKPKFDSIWSFREGLAKVGLNGKYGLIDKSGKIVIEPKFDDIRY
ncbi:WG repeat-containing protein, partial [Campylobacter coli]